ncbi:MAG TPA: translation initiation factor IF-2 subunit alpha [Methanomicrobia archaeon]|nr:translation initiation factor IF-2 subunit alpha [Methanomicrobia archaeon]
MVRDEWPEKGDLVICTVQQLESFGAFVTLDEYGNKEGLIHIGQVSSGWVKHLRDHVREGQKIVCKVLFVDTRRGHIDLSLKAVKDAQKRERIKEWKNEKKAKKWLTLALTTPTAAVKAGKEEREAIEVTLLDAYGSLYDAFEDVVREGKSVLIELGIAPEYVDAIDEVAHANVKLPSVQISGYLELKSPLPNGVEVIKEALLTAEALIRAQLSAKAPDETTEGTSVECFYIGAPRYRIRVTAPNYKEAESILSEAATTAISFVKQQGGSGKFFRNLT